MLKQDILALSALERRVLQDAFHEGISPRRVRGVVLSALVVLSGVVLFMIFNFGVGFFAGLTIATVMVSTFEKFSYQRTMLAYESVVRKLAHRVETLEGVELTPMVPSEDVPGVRVEAATKGEAFVK